jgi:RNA 2',3'-cyclic 3'-phosphodiesterase
MPDSTRTFIAIELDEGLKARLDRFRTAIGPEAPCVHWIEPDQMHVTLAFLGDVAHVDLANVCRAVAASVAGLPCLSVEVKGLGAFPNPTHPRVLWAGLTGADLGRLASMRNAIVEAVSHFGYPPDDRFHPHVTLGRLKLNRGRSLDLRGLMEKKSNWSAGALEVAEIVTFESALGPKGPSYNALARSPLGGAKSANVS